MAADNAAQDRGPRIDTTSEMGSLPDTKEGRYEGHGISAASVERTVMVTGSRDWRDGEKVAAVLGRIVGPDDTVIHGGAAGADLLAYDWCKQLGFKQQSFAPDYKRPSPQRYHERNDAMLDRADVVLAFWDGESRGTKSVIVKAVERALPLEVIR